MRALSHFPGVASWDLYQQFVGERAMLKRLAAFMICISVPAASALLACFVQNGFAAEKPQREKNAPLAILSISPSKAEPGMDVALYGLGFSDATRAFIGNKEVETTVTDTRQLTFTIPDLTPGTYALFVAREDGKRSKVYNFTVTPLTPAIESLVPDRISSCGGGDESLVQIVGRNFQERSQVLFDGAVIKSQFESPESISLQAPRVAGGLHTIQVKGPTGALSSAMALFIDSKPVITGVSQGDEFVNYYNLIIDGQNFKSNSMVVVNGKSMSSASVNPFDREKIRFVDCTRIIYERHPYDSEIKRFNLQVINPNGEESALFEVSAP
jgi:hypothetical protein